MRACLVEARTLSENKTLCPISRQERNTMSSDIPKGFNWEEGRRLCVCLFFISRVFLALEMAPQAPKKGFISCKVFLFSFFSFKTS